MINKNKKPLDEVRYDLDHLQPGKLMLHDFLVFRLNDSIDKIIVPIKSYKMD